MSVGCPFQRDREYLLSGSEVKLIEILRGFTFGEIVVFVRGSSIYRITETKSHLIGGQDSADEDRHPATEMPAL